MDGDLFSKAIGNAIAGIALLVGIVMFVLGAVVVAALWWWFA
jgi:hypothetical protein